LVDVGSSRVLSAGEEVEWPSGSRTVVAQDRRPSSRSYPSGARLQSPVRPPRSGASDDFANTRVAAGSLELGFTRSPGRRRVFRRWRAYRLFLYEGGSPSRQNRPRGFVRAQSRDLEAIAR